MTIFPLNGTGVTLSKIRTQIEEEIEGTKFLGRQLFEVWIAEKTPPQSGEDDAWGVCLDAVRNCDILVVLSNGNAGWAKAAGEIGICHAEMMTGLSQAPGKVRVIDLGNIPITKSPEGRRNARFQEYVRSQNRFRGQVVRNVDELMQRIRESLFDAVVSLIHAGVLEASKGRYHSGQALDWSRLDFKKRRDEMKRILTDALADRPESTIVGQNVSVILNQKEVICSPDAIPAALSIGPALEMVGRPFLRDHEMNNELKGKGGPVHIIACHKSATETQATKLLGFPDATVVSAPFGIYVADNIQKVQFIFLVNCRDEATTRHAVQRFFDWLRQNGEDEYLAQRALARARIVAAIANEQTYVGSL